MFLGCRIILGNSKGQTAWKLKILRTNSRKVLSKNGPRRPKLQLQTNEFYT